MKNPFLNTSEFQQTYKGTWLWSCSLLGVEIWQGKHIISLKLGVIILTISLVQFKVSLPSWGMVLNPAQLNCEVSIIARDFILLARKKSFSLEGPLLLACHLELSNWSAKPQGSNSPTPGQQECTIIPDPFFSPGFWDQTQTLMFPRQHFTYLLHP